MSYATIQTAISTVVQKVTGYSATNVFEHDWRGLGKGQTLVVVLKPGSFQQQDMNLKNSSLVTWTTLLELYILNKGELSTTLDTVIAEREKMVDIIHKWPHLGGTAGVLNSIIQSGGEIEIIEGTQWYRQVLTVLTQEAQTFTVAE